MHRSLLSITTASLIAVSGLASAQAQEPEAQQYPDVLNVKVQASLVAAGGKLYVPGVNGVVTVLQAGGAFKVLARNEIGEGIVASPALSQGRIFLRGEKHLFCIGGK